MLVCVSFCACVVEGHLTYILELYVSHIYLLCDNFYQPFRVRDIIYTIYVRIMRQRERNRIERKKHRERERERERVTEREIVN